LDVDIGADAVDYKYAIYEFLIWSIAYACYSVPLRNQESLSGLEVEMRKLEGVVKEIVDEMVHLQERRRTLRWHE